MKLLSLVPSFENRLGRRRCGVALVLVLSFLVIISGLIIAFFSMVTTEASSASTTAAATSAKSLADSAVSYVMGTIVDATLGHDPKITDKGGPINAWVWASQPGMIRTFDNAGAPKYVYKLYSADEMKLNIAAPAATETAGLSQWATGGNRDVWVDMNEPVKNALGDDVYPIVDPRAAEDYPIIFPATSYPGRDDSPTVPGNPSAEINTGATGRRVSGFHVLTNGAPTATTDPNAPLYDVNNNNPAPMPVKWLYVLQDGTLTTARVDGKNAALNGTAATATNPIKGRIAFWTDDESTKININTASEGTYWDVPRISSSADAGYIAGGTVITTATPGVGVVGLALCQPVYGEYQRYAGHPATTSLSTVFGFLGSGTTSTLNPCLPVPTPAANVPLNANDMAKIEKYYNLTPRISKGGSTGGTKVAFQTLPDASLTNIVQGNYWRLYTSVDELLFDAAKPGTSNSDTVHRSPNVPIVLNGKTVGSITPDMAQKSKFFLTANSSAPEVTLYNTPRISMWPVNDSSKIAPYNTQKGFKLQTTPYDDLAAFCSTVGPVPDKTQPTRLSTNVYYFTRWNARSQTADCLPSSRNMLLYNYLKALTSLPVPGNAGGGANNTFEKKFGADRDQVITSIYDYIRCTNMQDGTTNPSNPNNLHPYRYTPLSTFNGSGTSTDDGTKPYPGGGEVIPIRIGSTQGFGRFDTIGSAYLVVFPAHGRVYNLNASGSLINPNLRGEVVIVPQPRTVPPYPTEADVRGPIDALGVVFMVSYYNAMQGNVGNHPKTKIRVQNLNKLVFKACPFEKQTGYVGDAQGETLLTGFQPSDGAAGAGGVAANLNGAVLPEDGINYIETSDVRTWHGRSIGGTSSPVMGFSNGLFGGTGTLYGTYPNSKKCVAAGAGASGVNIKPGNYPFYGYTIQIPPPNSNKLTLAGPLGAPPIGFSANTFQIWPQKFSISQPPSNDPKDDIIVSIKTAGETKTPDSPSGNLVAEPEETVQEIHLRFPQFAIFQMPQKIQDSALPQADTNPAVQLAATSPDPVYNDVGAGFAAKAFYQTQGKYFYSNRLPNVAAGNGTDDLVRNTDVVVALEPAGLTSGDIAEVSPIVDHSAGDQRMYAASATSKWTRFQPDWLYGKGGNTTADFTNDRGSYNQMAHNMMRSISLLYHGVGTNLGQFVRVPAYSRNPDVPKRVDTFVARVDGGAGSWDTGVGMHKDGAYIGKPDEGDQNFKRFDTTPAQWRLPYFDKDDYYANSGINFSPNRQIPSPMVLGSIPTGIQRTRPWETLLFHAPRLSDAGNPGLQSPPDHYMADLFWMPVVEPYAISQPFSTAGKINMNYQIQPFTYIHRNTGMRAVMKAVKMMAITAGAASAYKPTFSGNGGTGLQDMRYPINLDATTVMLDKRFDTDHDIYRSATEIATVPLIPKDNNLTFSPGSDTYTTLAGKMDAYWGAPTGLQTSHQLTGNNLRDKPYADLYGRLTTKSNAFTVHVRAQALRKAPSTDPANAAKWIAGKDQVVAEYRGSSVIERYIDANDPLLPDFATATIADPASISLNIDQYYKFRTVSTKRFSP